MDSHLKLLADASLEVSAAEEALAEDAPLAAAERLDAAGLRLDELRAAWPQMSGAERRLVGAPAADVRARLDAARARLPSHSALTVGAPESDPDEEREPGD